MVARSHALQRDIAVSPFWVGFGAVGNGIADDNAALTAAAAYASTLAGATGRAWVDGAGNTFKVVSAAVVAPHNVGFRNMTVDFSTVAATANNYGSFYTAFAGQGSISADISTISSPTRTGAMGCTVNNNSLANGDLVMIGQNPPATRVNGSINSTDHTLTVDSTTGFPASGMLLAGSEIVAYISKTATTFTIRTTPEGRGRMGTTAATIADNARVVLVHSGHWALARTTPVMACEANYVQAAPRALAGGGYSILLRHSFDRIFSNGNSAWIKRITPLRRPALDNVTLVGSSSQGRSSGQEVGYYYRYADGLDVTNVKLINCSDAHGTLDTCFNFSVEQEVLGKADSSAYDGHYGLSLVNGCTWGNVDISLNRNAYKAATIWASGTSSSGPASTNWYGFGRHININVSRIYNCGTPWDNAHDMCEVHSWAENITINNAGGADAAGGVSTEGGKNIHFTSGLITRWARAVLAIDGAYALVGFTMNGMAIGDRTLLEAGTALDTTVDSSITTIIVDDAEWITDLTSDGTAVMVKIDSEWIKLGTRTTGGTFTGCTRGYYGTTAAAHTAGAIVYALGNAAARPIDMALGRCKFYLDDPDSYASKLSGAIIAGATTVGVSELSAFPAASATEIKFAEIEGENSADSYASEIISYTGKSATSGAGNLTGVVRGRKHTDDVAHSADMLIQPYVCAVRDVTLSGFNCTSDVPRAAVSVTGYVPTENCLFDNVSMRWAGTLRMNTWCGIIEPHGWQVRGGKLQNFPYGWRSYGNGQLYDGVAGELDTADATGGAVVTIHGDRTIAQATKAWRYYYTAQVVAGATKSAVHDSIGNEIASGTNGIADAGTSTSLVNNTAIA